MSYSATIYIGERWPRRTGCSGAGPGSRGDRRRGL